MAEEDPPGVDDGPAGDRERGVGTGELGGQQGEGGADQVEPGQVGVLQEALQGRCDRLEAGGPDDPGVVDAVGAGGRGAGWAGPGRPGLRNRMAGDLGSKRMTAISTIRSRRG